MNIWKRVERIEEEIEGVASQYGVTSWELTFLESIKELAHLSEKQADVLVSIEVKVFGGADD